MPTPILPKSAARLSENIVIGYAEIPSIRVDGILGWRLVNDTVTFNRGSAISAAEQMNKFIKKNLKGASALIAADATVFEQVRTIKDGLNLFPDKQW
jgi:hypothetical protein